MAQSYEYASEKFSTARRSLMLPHPSGTAASIASAFCEVSLGLEGLDRSQIPEPARDWVLTLDRRMDTAGVQDPAKRRTFRIKAEQLTEDE